MLSYTDLFAAVHTHHHRERAREEMSSEFQVVNLLLHARLRKYRTIILHIYDEVI